MLAKVNPLRCLRLIVSQAQAPLGRSEPRHPTSRAASQPRDKDVLLRCSESICAHWRIRRGCCSWATRAGTVSKGRSTLAWPFCVERHRSYATALWSCAAPWATQLHAPVAHRSSAGRREARRRHRSHRVTWSGLRPPPYALRQRTTVLLDHLWPNDRLAMTRTRCMRSPISG